jgi:hypothetical protein
MPRRKKFHAGGDENVDVDMGDVVAGMLPPSVPQNPDGSVATEGTVSVEQAQAIGALDIESAARNKHVAKQISKKIDGATVSWNCKDAIEMFDILKTSSAGEWSAILAHIVRLDPAPMVSFQPINVSVLKDSAALYAYILKNHGQSPTATYEVRFRTGPIQRGKAPITMPDTCVHAAEIQEPTWQPPAWQQPTAPMAPTQDPRGGVTVNMPPNPIAPRDAGMSEIISTINAQNKEMMGAFLHLMEKMTTPAKAEPPPMPPGFIQLPKDWPTPPGYFAVPGGCFPLPPQMQAPQVVQQAPVYAPPVQAAPVAAPVVMQPSDPISQTAGAMMMLSKLYKNMDDFKTMFGGQQAASVAAQVIEDAAEEVPAAVTTVKVGDIDMAINAKDGSTNWPATLMSALPKIVDVGKSAIAEYSKAQEKAANLSQAQTRSRIELANAVARAQGAMSPQILQAAPASVPPPPVPVPAPVPPIVNGVTPVRKSGMPANFAPISTT